MTLPLFPFQARGHGWLRLLGDLGIGAILADDMGLGKTVQAIAMLTSEREQFGVDAFGPTLVVCPMSVTRQWAREVERFAPGLRVHLHHGGERLTGDELLRVARASDVVITSYDIATRDIDVLATVAWDRLILDEAQDVKNPATKRARALRRLNARRVLAMTGTPIENRLDELWAIMDIVNPGLLGSRERFQRTFARPIEARSDSRAPRTAAGDGATVHPASPQGQPRGRARAARDHRHQGVLPAHARAGEPLSRDRRPLDAADRGARAQLRSARSSARDAQPTEAGLQPPGDAARHGTTARGSLREARAPRRAARGDADRRQGPRLHAVPRIRSPRTSPSRPPRPRDRVLPRWTARPAPATSSSRRSPIPPGRRCS